MTRFPRLLTLATLLLVAVAMLASPPKPDFTGKWVLNIAKSDFGPLPVPKSRTDEITQKGDHIKIVRTQTNSDDQTATLTLDCPIGGADCNTSYSTNQVTVKAKATWSGEALVVDMNLTSGENQLQAIDTMTLSADGKTITAKRHIATSMGEGDVTLVLDKQ